MKIEEVAKIIEEGDNFLIITHQGPDGDAIGSTLGMLSALHDNGKKAEAYFHKPLPDNYQGLPEIEFIVEDLPYLDSYGTILCLDFSNPKRFGDVDLSSYNTVNIDHHPDNSEFGRENFIFPRAAATAEIVFNIIKGIPNWTISPKTATFLMTGILMDTGGFRFDNTSPAVFKCAAELLELRADYSNIIKMMFFSKSADFAKMEADIILHHLQVACDGAYAYFYMSDELLNDYNIEEKDTEGLIDLIRAIKGFEIVAIFKKKDEGYRFSLRSKNRKYSVGQIARQFNGGGHELAAGGMIFADSIDEAEAIMLERIKLELKKS
jgi:phosphoesterase RecJ-like protein